MNDDIKWNTKYIIGIIKKMSVSTEYGDEHTILPNPIYTGLGPFWIHWTNFSWGWYLDPRFKKQYPTTSTSGPQSVHVLATNLDLSQTAIQIAWNSISLKRRTHRQALEQDGDSTYSRSGNEILSRCKCWNTQLDGVSTSSFWSHWCIP